MSASVDVVDEALQKLLGCLVAASVFFLLVVFGLGVVVGLALSS